MQYTLILLIAIHTGCRYRVSTAALAETGPIHCVSPWGKEALLTEVLAEGVVSWRKCSGAGRSTDGRWQKFLTEGGVSWQKCSGAGRTTWGLAEVLAQGAGRSLDTNVSGLAEVQQRWQKCLAAGKSGLSGADLDFHCQERDCSRCCRVGLRHTSVNHRLSRVINIQSRQHPAMRLPAPVASQPSKGPPA